MKVNKLRQMTVWSLLEAICIQFYIPWLGLVTIWNPDHQLFDKYLNLKVILIYFEKKRHRVINIRLIQKKINALAIFFLSYWCHFIITNRNERQLAGGWVIIFERKNSKFVIYGQILIFLNNI